MWYFVFCVVVMNVIDVCGSCLMDFGIDRVGEGLRLMWFCVWCFVYVLFLVGVDVVDVEIVECLS